MRTSVFTAPRIAAAALLMTIAFAAVPRTASALTIIHNGVVTGGVVTSALNQINVGLLDIRSGLVQNSDILQLCELSGANACLIKAWAPGTQNDVHLMQVAPDDPGIVIAELVSNATGVAWTDYHVEVENADIVSVEATLFLLDGTTLEVDEIMGGLTTQVTGNLVSFFFDPPLASPDLMASSSVLLGFLLELGNAEDTFLIGQTPSLAVPEPATLAILGLGLAGFGFVRRRRAGRGIAA